MPSRIEDLERRVRQDPSSIAFGALAEEYRRAGRLDEAVAACRAGLARHPSYLSARVTLGRALQEIGDANQARAEFTHVLSLAPDNLAAIRGLAELHGDDGDAGAPLAAPAPAFAPAPELAPEPAPVPEPVPDADPPPEPDFTALDASMERPDASSSAAAEREAQIERLEIWLARLDQAREA
ncbi:MAG TPA: tetratricopeptide repeat protein [Vicinamibacterales bacterium]|nr:tetratricopeptide repeat protein [Vicinamibacterales bacterium]